ncbi:MAG TPA: hypothetical protein VLD57_01945, partial [Blastocatellia bacterium]|nr:hypothetical protein [Blastocatellia bacterium]
MRGKRFSIRIVLILLIAALSSLLVTTQIADAQTRQITSPEKFFGFQMGADRKLARWDKLVEYYRQLERESPRIKVVDM